MIESNELQPMIPKKKVENATTMTLEQRMKDLINKGCVMVFMKGNRNEPRCGFSRQLMEILQGKHQNELSKELIGIGSRVVTPRIPRKIPPGKIVPRLVPYSSLKTMAYRIS